MPPHIMVVLNLPAGCLPKNSEDQCASNLDINMMKVRSDEKKSKVSHQDTLLDRAKMRTVAILVMIVLVLTCPGLDLFSS